MPKRVIRKPPRHAADALMAVFGLYPVKRRRKRKSASELDDDVPDEAWEKIFNKADNLIVSILSEGKNLANEYAWITREWRDRARKVAHDAGFETRVIYIKVEPEEIKRRWLENSKTKARFHWPEEEFKSYLRDFEEPTEDESIIVYNQSMPVDEMIKQI